MEIPRYRPADSAHNTAQPWGQHEAAPYSLEDTISWIVAVYGEDSPEVRKYLELAEIEFGDEGSTYGQGS